MNWRCLWAESIATAGKLPQTSACYPTIDSPAILANTFPYGELSRTAGPRGKQVMTMETMSRRMVLEAGACTLAAAAGIPQIASAHAETGLSPKNEQTIRKWYAAWEQKDWRPVDILLADDFTFTSANNDDHINKSTFKVRCWESQIDFIERFDLQRVFGSGNEALVLYVCLTKNGKTFRNVEYLRLRDDKVEAIECYFGAQSSFPSAVSTGRK
jgi:ketosteroid isomerase-like protein